MDSIRSGTVNLTKTQRRAVTAGDYEAIARADSRILDARCESSVWSRPTIWIAPRDQSLYGSPEMLEELVRVTEDSLTKVALAGVEPVVRAGRTLDFGVEVEVIAAPSVDVDYVAFAVQEALYAKFSYESGVFGEVVSADHIIRAISEAIPTSVVQFARVIGFSTGTSSVAEIDPDRNEIAVLPDPSSVVVTVTKNVTTGRTRF
jgi:hypothetical protein